MAQAERFLSRGYQGVVWLRESGADRVVVKQAMGRGLALWLRQLMLRREFAAYERLGSIPGVPRCLGMEADCRLLLEYLEGEPFRETAAALTDRDRFFSELLRSILAVHAAGVAHADLKRRGNILISPDGSPVLLDFGSAVLRSRRGGWLNGMVFRQVCRMDLNAWVKLKYRRRYDLISAEDRAYYHPTRVEAVARSVRRVWRKLSGRQLRKARRRRRANGQRGHP
jgi:RIO-like serine/threonine protein kinase